MHQPRQLSGHAAGFLYTDNTHSNANVSLLHIHDQSTAPGGVVRFKTILAHIERRLSAAPLFRQRLQRVPMGLDHPYWVDDEDFDLEYHVRHIALPKPGDWRQFCIQASRIHARALDLDRPLWELYVIEGLDSFLDLPVGSFALLFKTHLSAIELGALGALTELLHDLSPQPVDDGPPQPWFADSPPGRLSLLWQGLSRSASAPLRLVRPLARAAGQVAPAALALTAEMLRKPGQAPVTRFNAIVSPHRVFETRRFLVSEFEAIGALVRGATLDDVVHAVCGGALRRYLQPLGELPERVSLSAIVPRVRGAAEPPQLGDDPGLLWRHVPLGSHLADPVKRLAGIVARRRRAPDPVTRALGSRVLAEAGEQASAALLAASRRLGGLASAQLGQRLPPAHCSISQLPSPEAQMYLCGARMTYSSAILPITDGLGLAFAVSRYDGRLVISPTSCRELMPDPEAFAQALRDSFQEYLALAQPAVAMPPAARPTAKRASRTASRTTSQATSRTTGQAPVSAQPAAKPPAPPRAARAARAGAATAAPRRASSRGTARRTRPPA